MRSTWRALPLAAIGLLAGVCSGGRGEGEAPDVLAAHASTASAPVDEATGTPHSASLRAAPYAPELLVRDGAWTFTPSLSASGRSMAFARWVDPVFSGPDSNIQQLYLARRAADGGWSAPEVAEAFADYRVDDPHFSPDGRWLYLASTRPHPGQYGYPDPPYEDFDLWRVPMTGDAIDWSAAAPVPCADCRQPKTPANWNVRYVNNETSPRLDTLGNLYYWTERLGTGGWRDVYVAPPAADAGVPFGRERRLPFDTPQRESGVAVTRDGRTLIFASEGHGGAGGSDLFRVDREGDGWTTPRSLGPDVNTAYDEARPELVGDTLLLFGTDAPVPGYRGVDAGEGAVGYSVWEVGFRR